jgi:hypothetical protein
MISSVSLSPFQSLLTYNEQRNPLCVHCFRGLVSHIKITSKSSFIAATRAKYNVLLSGVITENSFLSAVLRQHFRRGPLPFKYHLSERKQTRKIKLAFV